MYDEQYKPYIKMLGMGETSVQVAIYKHIKIVKTFELTVFIQCELRIPNIAKQWPNGKSRNL